MAQNSKALRKIASCIFTVSLFLSSGLSSNSKAKSNAEELLPVRFQNYIFGSERRADFVHPVLRVRAGGSLLQKTVSDSSFAKMNRFVIPKSCPEQEKLFWRPYFSRCEVEAAWALCNRVVGLNKNQVKLVAGLPTYVFSKKCSAPLKSDDEFWIYNFGHDWIPLVFDFGEDRCLKADLFPNMLGFQTYKRLVDWRIENLSAFAIGKTEEQLKKELNNPILNRSDRLNSAPEMEYLFTKGIGLKFIFESGRCSRVEDIHLVF